MHDRGNSIFLGDSFANLPSPVGEGQTVKNFFKYNEDEEDKKELKKSNKDDKNEIKVEGKSKKPIEKKVKTQKEDEEDMNIDLEEIDKIVFQQTKKTKDAPKQKHKKQPSTDR